MSNANKKMVIDFWECPSCGRREGDVVYKAARVNFICLGRMNRRCFKKLSDYHQVLKPVEE